MTSMSGTSSRQPINPKCSCPPLLLTPLILLATVYSLGILDVVLLAPLWVQVSHLLAADTLWALLVVLTARVTLLPKSSGQ